jgi:hypothetical protein
MTTYKLKTPITTPDGDVVKEIKIGAVKVKHLKAAEQARADGGDMMASIAMIAAITELPVAAVEDMDARDFAALSEQVADFLPPPASAG